MDIDAIAQAICRMLEDGQYFSWMDDERRAEITEKIGDIIEQMG